MDGFVKTYRKNEVWSKHAKRNGLNNAILREMERDVQDKPPMELVELPMREKRVMPPKGKRGKVAKWGRNKPL